MKDLGECLLEVEDEASGDWRRTLRDGVGAGTIFSDGEADILLQLVLCFPQVLPKWE